MKRLIIIGFLVFVYSISNAQDQKNEILVGYGVISMQGIEDAFLDVIENIFISAQVDEDGSSSIGLFSVTYKREISKVVRMGLSGSIVKYNNKAKVTPSNGAQFTTTWDQQFITGMLRFDFHYVNKGMVTLYSGIAAGVSFENISNVSHSSLSPESNTYFAFQVNAFGIRVGKQFGGFTELGFGYMGALNFGLSLKL